jgi:hypothetical protein
MKDGKMAEKAGDKPKAVQISTTSGQGWHTLTVLLDNGEIWERTLLAGTVVKPFVKIGCPWTTG